jgi:hypothetical protein
MNAKQKEGEAALYPVLELAKLKVSPDYQRALNMGRARKLAREWRWDSYTPIRVARRPDGTLWIVDGQHEREALLIKGVVMAPCDLRESSGPADEAAEFARRNGGRAGLTRVQTIEALRVAGDPDTVAMYEWGEANGYRVGVKKSGTSPHPNGVGFIATLYDWWTRDREAAKRAMRFARAVVCPTDTMPVELFAGAALLFSAGIDLEPHIAKACQVGGAAQWLQRINALRDPLSGRRNGEMCSSQGIPRVAAQAILDVVNQGVRRTSKAFLAFPE